MRSTAQSVSSSASELESKTGGRLAFPEDGVRGCWFGFRLCFSTFLATCERYTGLPFGFRFVPLRCDSNGALLDKFFAGCCRELFDIFFARDCDVLFDSFFAKDCDVLCNSFLTGGCGTLLGGFFAGGCGVLLLLFRPPNRYSVIGLDECVFAGAVGLGDTMGLSVTIELASGKGIAADSERCGLGVFVEGIDISGSVVLVASFGFLEG